MRGRKRSPEEKGPPVSDGLSVLDLASAHTRACIEGATAEKTVKGAFAGQFKKALVSENCAVHPDQVPEVREHCKKAGIECPEFASQGRPKFKSPRHFRNYLRSLGKRHYNFDY